MRKRAAAYAWIALLLAMTAFAQDVSKTVPSRGNERPPETNLYGHLKKAFVDPADSPNLPRVLLIGDSISIGYTVPVREYLDGKANVHRPPENCQHTGHGMLRLKDWLGTGKWDVIHFNWGIWDTHYIDKETGALRSDAECAASPDKVRIRYTPEQYRENLTKLVAILKTTNARLIWASTIPVLSRKGDRFKDIERYNKVAESVMKQEGVEIDDLYLYTLPHAAEWQNPDQCHFNDLGNKNLGQKVGKAILDALEHHDARATVESNPLAMPKVEQCGESTIEGRKVVRYEHESLDRWKYPKPQRDYFFVAYPKQKQDSKIPLWVFLHSAGGSGESKMSSVLKTRSDGSSYELYLDCQRNKSDDWWWGYDSIRDKWDLFRNDLCPTEKRVLATVAWAISTFNIDGNRVYLCGVSMGGSGTLGIGLCHGDVFAAIRATVPAGAGHALLRMNVGQHPDPPPLFDFSSQNDFWSDGQEQLIAYCEKNRYFLAFAWGPFGHISETNEFNATVSEFPWPSIRKNEAYPVFTGASSDNVYPGFQNTTAPDQTGQINGCFRWKNVTDAPNQFVMELRLVRKSELKGPAEPPAAAIADVTLRRLQQFAVHQGETYHWKMIADGQSLQSGSVQVDASGALTIPKVSITVTPAKLEIVHSSRIYSPLKKSILPRRGLKCAD